MKYAFTLIELMIVVVILGVVATFLIPNFSNTRERAADTEVATMLQSIKSAEKMYRMRNDSDRYVACTNTTLCEGQLGLDLQGDGLWNYSVTTTMSGTLFEAKAKRLTTPSRTWIVNESSEPEKCTSC